MTYTQDIGDMAGGYHIPRFLLILLATFDLMDNEYIKVAQYIKVDTFDNTTSQEWFVKLPVSIDLGKYHLNHWACKEHSSNFLGLLLIYTKICFENYNFQNPEMHIQSIVAYWN